jgi:hypothetical protein
MRVEHTARETPGLQVDYIGVSHSVGNADVVNLQSMWSMHLSQCMLPAFQIQDS